MSNYDEHFKPGGMYRPDPTRADGHYDHSPGGLGTPPTWLAPTAKTSAKAGAELTYKEITSSVPITATAHGTETSIVTSTSFIFDGAAVMMEFFAPVVASESAAGGQISFQLYEGATQLGVIGVVYTQAAASQIETCAVFKWRFTPTAAAHSYTVSAYAVATTGTPEVYCGSGGTGTGSFIPCYLRFTKV